MDFIQVLAKRYSLDVETLMTVDLKANPKLIKLPNSRYVNQVEEPDINYAGKANNQESEIKFLKEIIDSQKMTIKLLQQTVMLENTIERLERMIDKLDKGD